MHTYMGGGGGSSHTLKTHRMLWGGGEEGAHTACTGLGQWGRGGAHTPAPPLASHLSPVLHCPRGTATRSPTQPVSPTKMDTSIGLHLSPIII